MKIALRKLEGKSTGYYMLLAGLGLIALIGMIAVWYMEHNGHIVTGMNNQIIWGMPHVFAVFLVVAASGALNVASMSSVFGKTDYKSLAPLSGVLAVALLLPDGAVTIFGNSVHTGRLTFSDLTLVPLPQPFVPTTLTKPEMAEAG